MACRAGPGPDRNRRFKPDVLAVLVQIPNVLSSEEVAQCRFELAEAAWADGRGSAGYLSQSVKKNQQLADGDAVANKLGKLVLAALDRSPMFTAAALPLKVLPPQFNRYTEGQGYGGHIDGAIRSIGNTTHRVRTDLSATLFLSEPDEYEGGELVIQEGMNERHIKLAAGDMLLYPGTFVHRVATVRSGERLAAFFWIQSMVREVTDRAILFELDTAIQKLGAENPENPTLIELAGVYHNLLRRWTNT